jgi:hypothetical protein
VAFWTTTRTQTAGFIETTELSSIRGFTKTEKQRWGIDLKASLLILGLGIELKAEEVEVFSNEQDKPLLRPGTGVLLPEFWPEDNTYKTPWDINNWFNF